MPRSEGETRSYSEIAASIGRPSAVRAVAWANGANQLAIVIPCHRVIHAKGIWPDMAAAWRAKGGSWIMRRKVKRPN